MIIRDVFFLFHTENTLLLIQTAKTCVLCSFYKNIPNYYQIIPFSQSSVGFDKIRSGNIISFLLPLFQEGQLSVTGESMCTKYWLTA